MITDVRRHWDDVYGSKAFDEVSWYQPVPEISLRHIRNVATSHDAAIIDVGGGASTLVDNLLNAGFNDVTVLDICEDALQQAKRRLGPRAGVVNWVVADVRMFLPERKFSLWHDRAVLHFLIDAEDRAHYIEALGGSLSPGGSLVLSTFGPEGPLKCSGLPIRRYDLNMLADFLGEGFELQGHEFEDHETPDGAKQQFLCTSWTRKK